MIWLRLITLHNKKNQIKLSKKKSHSWQLMSPSFKESLNLKKRSIQTCYLDIVFKQLKYVHQNLLWSNLKMQKNVLFNCNLTRKRNLIHKKFQNCKTYTRKIINLIELCQCKKAKKTVNFSNIKIKNIKNSIQRISWN